MIICDCKELEFEDMPTNWGIREHSVVYDCYGILLCFKKWWARLFQEIITWADAKWSEQNQENIIPNKSNIMLSSSVFDLASVSNTITEDTPKRNVITQAMYLQGIKWMQSELRSNQSIFTLGYSFSLILFVLGFPS